MYNAIQCEVRQQNNQATGGGGRGHMRLGVADKVRRERHREDLDFGRGEYAKCR